MKPEWILQPVIAMAVLSLLAGLRMYSLRITAMARRRADPDAYRTRNLATSLGDKADAASDNFVNMFELPVVFYAVVFSVYLLQAVDAFYLYAAWGFVATRLVHHLIHVTYNRVVHRFAAYISGFAIVLVMTLRLGYQVVAL